MSLRLWSALRARGVWFAYGLLAVVCTAYLNGRTRLVPHWGEWYAGDIHPYILLQLRAWLSGHLALMPHPGGAANDYLWGRGGMHTAWGLGVPLLALPFHLLGRLFGAPGFPDDARFLVLFGLTTIALARALHEAAPREPSALMASLAAAGFVMLLPNFVGLIAARFLVYEQTIAVGALWDVLLLAGALWLLRRCTPVRLVLVCAAAGFAVVDPRAARRNLRSDDGGAGAGGGREAAHAEARAPRRHRRLCRVLGALLHRKQAALRRRAQPGIRQRHRRSLREPHGPLGTVLLDGPAEGRREGDVRGPPLSRSTRDIMMGTPPEAVRPYVVGNRWREYSSPTFDLLTFALCMVTLVIVGWRVVRGRLWHVDRPLEDERATLIGAWALPPAIVLFGFYARVGTSVTRYSTDLYPAFAAAFLAVGMSQSWTSSAGAIRASSPRPSSRSRAGPPSTSRDGGDGPRVSLRRSTRPRVDDGEGRRYRGPFGADYPPVPDHFACGAPRGASPVHTHLEDWHGDCSFSSGMVFAMPAHPVRLVHVPCRRRRVGRRRRQGAGRVPRQRRLRPPRRVRAPGRRGQHPQGDDVQSAPAAVSPRRGLASLDRDARRQPHSERPSQARPDRRRSRLPLRPCVRLRKTVVDAVPRGTGERAIRGA